MTVGGLPTPGGCVVMGVLNVTADSFSDGGRYLGLADAVAHGLALRDQGAHLVDVGGESTRPGAERVPSDLEVARTSHVIAALSAQGVVTSVDTTRSEVAVAALEAGVSVVNDVSGGLADPDMLRVVAEADVPYVVMHWRGHSAGMDRLAEYSDVVREVRDELSARVDAALAAGVRAENVVVDPGLGFAKRAEHNWQLLNRLDELIDLGFPVLVGASRKRFLGALLGERPPAGREDATAAVSALAAFNGAWGVRVHDVPRSVDAVAVAGAWRAGRG
nr:dihydropteroate synthase [Actinosynnema mirum]